MNRTFYNCMVKAYLEFEIFHQQIGQRVDDLWHMKVKTVVSSQNLIFIFSIGWLCSSIWFSASYEDCNSEKYPSILGSGLCNILGQDAGIAFLLMLNVHHLLLAVHQKLKSLFCKNQS